jgi:hypothetical protein
MNGFVKVDKLTRPYFESLSVITIKARKCNSIEIKNFITYGLIKDLIKIMIKVQINLLWKTYLKLCIKPRYQTF